MSVVEQKKERIRLALQELGNPTSKRNTFEAMITLIRDIWASKSFEETDGSIGDLVGDDVFKEEIFSARVIQDLITVSQDKDEFPAEFYKSVSYVFFFLCDDNIELSTTFVANGGVEFLLETLEAFSSN
jgi:hypothetical protein